MSATKTFAIDFAAANRGALRSATALGRVLTVAAAATAMTSDGAKAGPKGGVVKAGGATITTRGGTTTINQSGQKVVIDWQSFDIDANEAVNFLQPGKGSIALNRVLNDLPTHIRGQLTANGNIWIVNQHGVTFHAGSVVNVGSLIATTADIDNADFMAGNYRFDKPGDPNAKIINEGEITFGEAGLAAFVAPSAVNRGVIAGKMGKVVIAGNETFAVDLAGDGMWAFTLGEGANGASAANSGRIHNPGGYILISARAAQGMVDSQISVGGVVEATSARVEGGKIVLSGDGFVEVSGALDATGSEAGQVGGSIEVTGDKVHVTGTAKIDASGDAGGGSVKIGGDYQGGGALKTASRTLVSEGAEIRASAIGQVGDGGEVIVWADEITGFFGSIQATGGANAGDGGFAEVSGKQQLAFDGMVDLTARNGLPGTLLLDPQDIIITDASGADDGELADNEILAGDGGAVTFTISDDAIESALTTASVTITATNSITQNNDATIDFSASAYNLSLQTTSGPILLQTTVNAGAGGLTLNAGGDLTISGAVVSAGPLDFDAGGSIALNSAISSTADDISLTATTAPTGTVTFGAAVDGANIDITTAAAVALGDIGATGSLTVTSGGAITQTAASNVTGLATFNTSANAITLTQTGNTFGSVAADTTYTGATTAAVTITEADGVDLAGVDASAMTVTAGGVITDSGANSISGASSLTTTGDAVTLDETGNDFGSVAVNTRSGMSAAANVVITDANSVGIGAINAASLTITAGGNVTQNGGTTVSATGTTTLSVTGGGVTLAEATNDFAAVTGSANGISLQDANSITLEALTAGDGAISVVAASSLYVATNANVSATDDVSLTASSLASQISITGTSQITADSDLDTNGDITFSAPLGFFQLLSSSSAVSGANVNLSAVVLDIYSSVTATSGDVDIDSILEADVLGDVTATTPGSIVTIDADRTISLGNIDANAVSIESADRDVIQTVGAITTAVGTTVSDFTAAGSVTLNQTGNDFQGPTALSGQTLTIRDTDALILDAVTATGTFTVNAGGAVTQYGASVVTASQTATITATGQTIDLSKDNDFQSTFVATGGAVSVTDVNAIELGAISASTLTVEAGGAVTQIAATTVTNETSVTATGQTVDLSNASNDFQGAVSAEGQTVTLVDANSLTLGVVDTGGTLSVQAIAGDILDTGTSVISATGQATFVASNNIEVNRASQM